MAIRATRLQDLWNIKLAWTNAVCWCVPQRNSDTAERRRVRTTNRIAIRLTPNYVLMKINCYICRIVSPRISRTSTLRPRSSSSLLPSLFLSLPPLPSLSLSLALFRTIVLSSYFTPPVWFFQRDTSVYLSISVCFLLPRQSHPRDLDGI